MFMQRELFNILVSERRLRHRELRNKGKLMREFDTGYLVVVSKQVNSSRKYGISQKLVFKTKVPYIVLEKATPSSFWLQSLPFLGSMEARKKSGIIRSQYGKYTIHHGSPQACGWGGHNIFPYGRTIGKNPLGKWNWGDKKRYLPRSV